MRYHDSPLSVSPDSACKQENHENDYHYSHNATPTIVPVLVKAEASAKQQQQQQYPDNWTHCYLLDVVNTRPIEKQQQQHQENDKPGDVLEWLWNDKAGKVEKPPTTDNQNRQDDNQNEKPYRNTDRVDGSH